MLSRDEFLDVFFDDLELPDLVKRQIATTDTMSASRAGLSSDGSPSQLDLGRTMRHSMARRIGLKRPKPEAVTELELRIEALEQDGADARRGGAAGAEVGARGGAAPHGPGAVDRSGRPALPPVHTSPRFPRRAR